MILLRYLELHNAKDCFMAKRDYYLKSPLDGLRRNLHELCNFIVAKEKPTAEDFFSVFKLLKRDKELRGGWPGNILYCRLQPLEQNLQESDLGELILLVKQIITPEPNAVELLRNETWLGLELPVPRIIFSEKVFCFLCSFAFGSKEKCKEAVSYLGGGWDWSVDEATDYVIVGAKGREDLICRDNDFKSLEAAKQSKSKGGKCKIVLEEHRIRELPTEPDFHQKISGCNNFAGPALSFSMGVDDDGNTETTAAPTRREYPSLHPRLRAKWRILARLQECGIWLLDASVHAIYRRNGIALPLEAKQQLHREWWEDCGQFVLNQTQVKDVWIVGKTVFDTLDGIDRGWRWIYQPRHWHRGVPWEELRTSCG